MMANRSTYVDARLAAPMREGQTSEIPFPEIKPEEWDLMISYLEKLAEARGMKIGDAKAVAEWYDKYGFA